MAAAAVPSNPKPKEYYKSIGTWVGLLASGLVLYVCLVGFGGFGIGGSEANVPTVQVTEGQVRGYLTKTISTDLMAGKWSSCLDGSAQCPIGYEMVKWDLAGHVPGGVVWFKFKDGYVVDHAYNETNIDFGVRWPIVRMRPDRYNGRATLTLWFRKIQSNS